MEHRLFDAPRFHDARFYGDREAADHLNQPGHRERLLHTADVICGLLRDRSLTTVSDWCCGNGGLLYELNRRRPDITSWGYDLCPQNVKFAREQYQTDVNLVDVTNGEARVGDVVVLTEALEHLVDPHGLLEKLRGTSLGWIVASSPAHETVEAYYPLHLWIWTDSSYVDMFKGVGFVVTDSHVANGAQFIVARPGGTN